jgi:hypothetical protein
MIAIACAIDVSVSTVVIQFFTCLEVTSTSRVVASFPAVSCESPEYESLRPLLITITALFVAGVPIFIVAALLINHRRKLLFTTKHISRYGPVYVPFSIDPLACSAQLL